MKVKPSVNLLTLSAAVFSASLLAQSDSAFDNAGDNAAFKRCATAVSYTHLTLPTICSV